jgi:hypothetical protein
VAGGSSGIRSAVASMARSCLLIRPRHAPRLPGECIERRTPRPHLWCHASTSQNLVATSYLHPLTARRFALRLLRRGQVAGSPQPDRRLKCRAISTTSAYDGLRARSRSSLSANRCFGAPSNTQYVFRLGLPLPMLVRTSSTPEGGNKNDAPKAWARLSMSSSEFDRLHTLIVPRRSNSAWAYA